MIREKLRKFLTLTDQKKNNNKTVNQSQNSKQLINQTKSRLILRMRLYRTLSLFRGKLLLRGLAEYEMINNQRGA